MKAQAIEPTGNLGWIETQLDEHHIEFLWKRIKESDGKSMKDNLIGNISKSLIIEDRANFFFKKVLLPHVQKYRNTYQGDPIRPHVYGNVDMVLNGFWANYQYQHEFNPYHHHGGIYSFVVWLKIPYDWKEQHNLPFMEGIKDSDRKASDFEFEYCDLLGDIRNHSFKLDKSMEGRMLFFPAGLRHTVYPFYNCEEPRISVAGNVWFKTK